MDLRLSAVKSREDREDEGKREEGQQEVIGKAMARAERRSVWSGGDKA